jgi:hypothetical protein
MTVWECDRCGTDLRFGTPSDNRCLRCRTQKDLQNIEDFWRQVCERANRDGVYNDITRGIVRNYERAATEIIAEMRRAAE